MQCVPLRAYVEIHPTSVTDITIQVPTEHILPTTTYSPRYMAISSATKSVSDPSTSKLLAHIKLRSM